MTMYSKNARYRQFCALPTGVLESAPSVAARPAILSRLPIQRSNESDVLPHLVISGTFRQSTPHTAYGANNIQTVGFGNNIQNLDIGNDIQNFGIGNRVPKFHIM